MDIRQLGVSETIHVDRLRAASTMRKTHLPTMRSCLSHKRIVPSDVLYVPSKYVHEVLGHPVYVYLFQILLMKIIASQTLKQLAEMQ